MKRKQKGREELHSSGRQKLLRTTWFFSFFFFFFSLPYFQGLLPLLPWREKI
jgi:hypothetical protein